MMYAATSVERLLLHDRYVRVFALEVLSLFLLLSTVIILVLRDLHLSLITLAPAMVTVPAWLLWEQKRKSRVLKIFKVSKVVNSSMPLADYRVPINMLVLDAKLTMVEALHGSQTIRYLDYEERSLGEQVLLVIDGSGRVLAAESLSRPPSLKLLMKIR
ncbi:MAG: hypothetical protein QW555_06360 [Nitrososphaerota archaeon]